MRIYLASSSTSYAERDSLSALLLDEGYAVTCATDTDGLDVDDPLDAVEGDVGAVGATDLVILVGDCSTRFEPVAAELYGVPTVTAAEAFAGVAR